MPTPQPSPAASAGLDAKIAAADGDAEQILRMLDTELTLRRASRDSAGSSNLLLWRMLSVVMLVFVLLVVLGAMFYLQTQRAAHPHPPASATANPAPGP